MKTHSNNNNNNNNSGCFLTFRQLTEVTILVGCQLTEQLEIETVFIYMADRVHKVVPGHNQDREKKTWFALM